MTLKNNRAPLLCCFQLCAWFHCHMWIQTGVRVRKRLSWVLTLTFDLWPWPFAWTSLLTMVITPENFMMIRWWEHGEKGVTDGQTDRQTDGQTENTICRADWSQLKKYIYIYFLQIPVYGSRLFCSISEWVMTFLSSLPDWYFFQHRAIVIKGGHLGFNCHVLLIISPILAVKSNFLSLIKSNILRFITIKIYLLSTWYWMRFILYWVPSSSAETGIFLGVLATETLNPESCHDDNFAVTVSNYNAGTMTTLNFQWVMT